MSWPAPLGRPSPVSHRVLKALTLSPQASPAQVRFCERIVMRCPRNARIAWGRALARLDLRHAVQHLTVPTTVLVGTADRLTPPVHAERLAAALPRLERMIELPDAGHMTPVERPDEVNAEIRRLVADHLAAERAA
jgi:pimeloyl-ACP methyl ester carboxylesterase